MKKILNIVYIVLFLAVICLLVGTMNTEKGVASDIDNRMLTEFPELGDPDYFGTLEQYIKDRIGFRNEMLSVYSLMNEAVVDELDHPNYCNGQEGYVFFKMHKNVKYGEFHKTFAEMVKKLQTYCNERGTKFYLIFDPEKISVYRRYLPKGFYYNDDWVDQFCEYLDELGVTYVNNSKMLIERSYKEQVYNWKYDAGHWNDLGCFYATAELYELIRKDFPQVPQLTKDMFDITTTIAEKLYNSEIVINEEVPSFTLKTGFTNLSGEWSNEITVNQSYAHFHYYKNNAEGAENLPKTLIFQGSYYNRNPNYLIACANESIGIHNYQNIINFDYYYNIFQPDMVIFDVAEYVFSDTYFNSANMKTMDLNPSIWDGQGTLADRIEALKAGAADGGLANVSVVPGRSVENIEVIGDFTGAKYAYIISNGQIADLSPSDEMLDAVVASGFVSGDTYIYVIKEDGSKAFYSTNVVEKEPGSTGLVNPSGNTTIEGTVITMIPDREIEGTTTPNAMNGNHLQLIASDGSYLGTFFDVAKTGAVSTTFHLSDDQPSGWYFIRIKANTNLKDESVDLPVYIKNGDEYRITYNVLVFEENKLVISDFYFGK